MIEWTEIEGALHALMGKRVRYHDEGMAPTQRCRTDEGHVGEFIEAPYSVTVEGEASGWEVHHGQLDGAVLIRIAGYGMVPAALVTVVEEVGEQ